MSQSNDHDDSQDAKNQQPVDEPLDQIDDDNEELVNIAPGVGVYGMFPSFNYKPWLALGEFLDNSISSYQKHQKLIEEVNGSSFKLKIMIDYDADRGLLEIRDNAAGIDKKHFGRAFALAKPPDDLRFISRYGVGMKAAACWFARDWSVRTSAIGESVERTLDWSTKAITEGKSETLEPSVRQVPKNEHYTVITLRNLIHPPSGPKTVAKIKTYLPNIYREFIRDEQIEILWNGQKLDVEQQVTLVAPPQWDISQPAHIWDESVELAMEDGRTIKGRVFLLKKMKRSYTALNLFWHKRLILGNVGENHRPVELFGAGNSFETGRLCVELYLDEYEPTVDKMGFKFQDNEATLEEIIDALKISASQILRQAREYREPKVDIEELPPDVGPIIMVPGTTVVVDPVKPTATDPYPAPKADAPSGVAIPREVTKVALVIDGVAWEIVVRLGLGPGENIFVNIEEKRSESIDDPQQLFVTLGMEHPFVVNYWTDDRSVQKFIIIMASAIGFGEIAARRAGAKFPSYVRNNIDQFLRLVALGNSGFER
jgi:hypothetical protein